MFEKSFESREAEKAGLDALDEPGQLGGIGGILNKKGALAVEILKQIVIDALGNGGTVVGVHWLLAPHDEREEISVAGEAMPQPIADSRQGSKILFAAKQQFGRSQGACRDNHLFAKDRTSASSI